MTINFPDYITFIEDAVLTHLLRGDEIMALRTARLYHVSVEGIRKKYSKELVFAKLKQTC